MENGLIYDSKMSVNMERDRLAVDSEYSGGRWLLGHHHHHQHWVIELFIGNGHDAKEYSTIQTTHHGRSSCNYIIKCEPQVSGRQ